MIALVLSMFLPVAQAACPAPTPMAELAAHVDDSTLSFATLDEEGFIESSDALLVDLPCLSEIAGQQDAASIHRALAMRAFWDGDDAGATSSFRAARRLEPNHVISDKIAPEGGPLATLYAGASSPSVRMTGVSAPSWTTVYVDGDRASRRPSDAPAVVQYEVGGEGVVWSGLLPAGADLPSLEAARAQRGGPAADVAVVADGGVVVVPADPTEPTPVVTPTIVDIDSSDAVAGDARTPRERAPRERREPGEGGKSAKGPLLAATVATGVVAAGLFGVSAYSRSQFNGSPSKREYNLTNGAFFGSVGAAAVTAGLLTATIAVK